MGLDYELILTRSGHCMLQYLGTLYPCVKISGARCSHGYNYISSQSIVRAVFLRPIEFPIPSTHFIILNVPGHCPSAGAKHCNIHNMTAEQKKKKTRDKNLTLINKGPYIVDKKKKINTANVLLATKLKSLHYVVRSSPGTSLENNLYIYVSRKVRLITLSILIYFLSTIGPFFLS